MDFWQEAICWAGAFLVLPVIIGGYFKYMSWVYRVILSKKGDC